MNIRSLLIICAITSLFSWGASGGEEKLVRLGDQAVELPQHGWVNSKPLSLKDLKGKYTILYFFHPGCGTCNAFTLHLRRLSMRHPGKLVGIGIADRAIKEMKKMTEGINTAYSFLQDSGQVLSKRYLGKIDVMPAYALLDPEQRLIWIDQGQDRLVMIQEMDRIFDKPHKEKLPSSGRTVALVIGIDKDPLTNLQLKLPSSDATAIAARLKKSGCNTVSLLTDREKPVTLNSVFTAIADLSLTRDDQVLFFFSGSGLQKGKGLKTDIELLLAPEEDLSLKEIAKQFKRSCSQSLIMLDIGHARSKAAPYDKLTDTLDKVFDNTTIIFSCSERRGMSYPMPAGKNTRFVATLLDGLGGAADINKDKVINGRELYRYIWLTLNDMNRSVDNKQMPFAAGLRRKQQVKLAQNDK